MEKKFSGDRKICPPPITKKIRKRIVEQVQKQDLAIINPRKARGPDGIPLTWIGQAAKEPWKWQRKIQETEQRLGTDQLWQMRVVPLKKKETYDPETGNF